MVRTIAALVTVALTACTVVVATSGSASAAQRFRTKNQCVAVMLATDANDKCVYDPCCEAGSGVFPWKLVPA